MRYRKLGNTGVTISELSLGTWLTYGQSTGLQNARDCIQAAFDAGINFFDTADVYGFGQAEIFLGRCLENLPREQFLIATKCYFPMSEDPHDRGLSKEHILKSVDRSLKNLKMDYLDLMQCHRFDPVVPLAETIETMNSLIKAGKILYWGVSRWLSAQMIEANQIAKTENFQPPVSNQYFYHMLNPEIENDILKTCEQLNMTILAYSPLAQGVLTGKYLTQTTPECSRASHELFKKGMWDLKPEQNYKILKLKELAERHDISLTKLALSWVLRKKNITTAIIGASRPQQIQENIQSLNFSITPEIENEIKTIML